MIKQILHKISVYCLGCIYNILGLKINDNNKVERHKHYPPTITAEYVSPFIVTESDSNSKNPVPELLETKEYYKVENHKHYPATITAKYVSPFIVPKSNFKKPPTKVVEMG
jgi:hypothetical protein